MHVYVMTRTNILTTEHQDIYKYHHLKFGIIGNKRTLRKCWIPLSLNKHGKLTVICKVYILLDVYIAVIISPCFTASLPQPSLKMFPADYITLL